MVRLYNENPSPKVIAHVAEILRNGGVVIYPTDTVYAIGCDITQQNAIERICKLKGIDLRREQFSMICADFAEISRFAKVDNATFRLLKNNLPGAFTFILNGTNALPKLLKNRKTIGIRMPDNNITLELAKALGTPLLTTSLHHDEPTEYETDPELIQERYGRQVDIIINGGMGGTTASTIVDCTCEEPTVVREGMGILK